MFLNVIFTLIKFSIEFGLNLALDVVCLFVCFVYEIVYFCSCSNKTEFSNSNKRRSFLYFVSATP